MRNAIYRLRMTTLIITLIVPCLYAQKATDPIIYADVPDKITAQNPLIQTIYTADPAPIVFGDTLFLYVGHDEDDAHKDPHGGYLMREYRLFTTTDMVNWTDHGAPLKIGQISWSTNDASAAQLIERNGKYYWYFSTGNKNDQGVAVGVAVSDSHYGPFKDAIGKALITNSMTTYAPHFWDNLDPTVFIDDDGQAYLFWGNAACYWVKLNKDMISIDGEIHALDIKDKTAFAGTYTEAPWVYKRNKQYYIIYAAEFPENISYSTSKKNYRALETTGHTNAYGKRQHHQSLRHY